VTRTSGRPWFPARWPRFFHELIGLLSSGEGAADVFCRILDAVDDEVINPAAGAGAGEGGGGSSGGSGGGGSGGGGDGGGGGGAFSTRLKDAMRDDGDCLPQLAETWRAMIAFGNGGGGKPEMAAAAAATARRFVDWVDIGLFTSEAFMGSTLALLGSQHGRTWQILPTTSSNAL